MQLTGDWTLPFFARTGIRQKLRGVLGRVPGEDTTYDFDGPSLSISPLP